MNVLKKLAAVGAGAAFRFYERAVEQLGSAEFIAIVDPNQEAGRNSKGQLVATTLRGLKGLPLDAVIILSPHCYHAKQAVEAVQLGFHVLCEKPLGINIRDAVAAVDYAQRQRRWLQVAMHCRYRPEIEYLYRNIDGPVIYFEQRYREDWMSASSWFFNPKISGGGVLLDVGINQIDWVFPFIPPMRVMNAECEMETGKVEVECRIEWSWKGGNGRTDLSWSGVNQEKRSTVVTQSGTRFELDHQRHLVSVDGQACAVEECREYEKVVAQFLSGLERDPKPDLRAIHVLTLLRSVYESAGLTFLL